MEIIDLNLYRDVSDIRKGIDFNLRADEKMWELIKDLGIYPPDLSKGWVYSKQPDYRGRRETGFLKETYTKLVMVDADSYGHMYRELYNPVVLSIMTDLVDPEKSLYLSAMCISIDDAAYGVKIRVCKDYDGLSKIRDSIIEYIDNNPEPLNVFRFQEFGESLGGEIISW